MDLAKKIIERLKRENEVCSIKILGDKKNKLNAFEILMEAQPFTATKEDTYHCIDKKTLGLFKEAKIKFKVI